MSITELLEDVRSAGLSMGLNTTGDKLVLEGPEDTLTTGLREQITAHKAELIALLQSTLPTPPTQPTPISTATIWQVSEAEVAKVYETKATVPGGIPPYQRALAQQVWLATLDWRYGLRCGKTGQQCRVCKGIPCHDSAPWIHPDDTIA